MRVVNDENSSQIWPERLPRQPGDSWDGVEVILHTNALSVMADGDSILRRAAPVAIPVMLKSPCDIMADVTRKPSFLLKPVRAFTLAKLVSASSAKRNLARDARLPVDKSTQKQERTS
jgi:hypothetical protein